MSESSRAAEASAVAAVPAEPCDKLQASRRSASSFMASGKCFRCASAKPRCRYSSSRPSKLLLCLRCRFARDEAYEAPESDHRHSGLA